MAMKMIGLENRVSRFACDNKYLINFAEDYEDKDRFPFF